MKKANGGVTQVGRRVTRATIGGYGVSRVDLRHSCTTRLGESERDAFRLVSPPTF